MNNKRVGQVVLAVLLGLGMLIGAGAIGFRIALTQSPQIIELMTQRRQAMRPPPVAAATGDVAAAPVPPQAGPRGPAPQGRGPMMGRGDFGRGQMGRGPMMGHGNLGRGQQGPMMGRGQMQMRGGFGGGGIFGGLLHFILMLAVFFFVAKLLRRLFWGGHMGWGGGRGWGGPRWGGPHAGPDGNDVPPHFAEWYRRMREKEATVKTEATSGTTPSSE